MMINNKTRFSILLAFVPSGLGQVEMPRPLETDNRGRPLQSAELVDISASEFSTISKQDLIQIKLDENQSIEQCWTCNGSSMSECSSTGRFETCGDSKDNNNCFMEIRRKESGKIRISSGCKSQEACKNMQNQNFVGPFLDRTQCRPEYAGGRGRFSSESVCRQCFSACDSSTDPTRCFDAGNSLQTFLSDIPDWQGGSWDPLTITSRSWWSSDLYVLQTGM